MKTVGIENAVGHVLAHDLTPDNQRQLQRKPL